MVTEEEKAKAATGKEEGNGLFASGKFAEAVDAYSRSIEFNPNDHLLFSNRSAAYLKLGDSAAEALADAEKCIELAPAWPKSYRRQASALEEMKRWDEAVAACQRGLAVSSGDGLQKLLEEVRVRQFQFDVQGTWHGRVKDQLGGYEQEMEFSGGSLVRIEVLGRSINGHWWVDLGPSPFHLNIRVDGQDVPQGVGAPSPPPVPYIARIDDAGLHLCCPVLRMDRPKEFDGDGYCLMTRGPIQSDENDEVQKLSKKDKLLACVQELTDAVPDTQLKDISHSDSEGTAREKVMMQVRFESAMYAVQKKFGEAVMKEVLDAARSPGTPHEILSNVKAMHQLTDKLKASGVLAEEPDEPMRSAPAAPSPAKSAPAASHSAPPAAAAPRKPDADEGTAETQTSTVAIAATVMGVTAALAAAFMIWRRQKR